MLVKRGPAVQETGGVAQLSSHTLKQVSRRRPRVGGGQVVDDLFHALDRVMPDIAGRGSAGELKRGDLVIGGDDNWNRVPSLPRRRREPGEPPAGLERPVDVRGQFR